MASLSFVAAYVHQPDLWTEAARAQNWIHRSEAPSSMAEALLLTRLSFSRPQGKDKLPVL